MRDCLKYRLKKDTPFYKKGTEFCEDWFHKGVLLNDNCNVVANLNELNNPDEWFEKVDESVEWLHDGVSYYQPEVNILTKKFVSSYNEYWGDAHDEARRHIGICYKSRESCQRFIDFLTAVEVVSHDDGFMPNVPKRSSVWVIGYNDAGVIAPMATARGFAGSFRFYAYSQARDSLDKHPNEWQTILNYDWSKE